MDGASFLKKARLFADMSGDEVDEILSLSTERTYGKGDVIFYEHSPGQELFILLKGKVAIKLMVVSDRNRISVYSVKPGNTFGELALIDSGPRSATALCEEDTVVKVLMKSDIDNLTEKNHRLGMILYRNLSKVICHRLRKTNEKLINNVTWGVM